MSDVSNQEFASSTEVDKRTLRRRHHYLSERLFEIAAEVERLKQERDTLLDQPDMNLTREQTSSRKKRKVYVKERLTILKHEGSDAKAEKKNVSALLHNIRSTEWTENGKSEAWSPTF